MSDGRRSVENVTATSAAPKRVQMSRQRACWCPEGLPCHADVLLEIANRKAVSA